MTSIEERNARDPRKRILMERDELLRLQGAIKERDRVKAWLQTQKAKGVTDDVILHELEMAVLA